MKKYRVWSVSGIEQKRGQNFTVTVLIHLTALFRDSVSFLPRGHEGEAGLTTKASSCHPWALNPMSFVDKLVLLAQRSRHQLQDNGSEKR